MRAYRGKLTKNHYQLLFEEIKKIGTDNASAHLEDVKQGGRFKDLKIRFCWDCLWIAKRNNPIVVRKLIDEIYQYANDQHLLAALTHIVCKELNWMTP